MTQPTVSNKAAYGQDITAPASGVFVITPHDTNELSTYTRAIRATIAGNIKINGVDGIDCVCAFTAGETRPIRARLIYATGTTATGIEGMY